MSGAQPERTRGAGGKTTRVKREVCKLNRNAPWRTQERPPLHAGRRLGGGSCGRFRGPPVNAPFSRTSAISREYSASDVPYVLPQAGSARHGQAIVTSPRVNRYAAIRCRPSAREARRPRITRRFSAVDLDVCFERSLVAAQDRRDAAHALAPDQPISVREPYPLPRRPTRYRQEEVHVSHGHADPYHRHLSMGW